MAVWPPTAMRRAVVHLPPARVLSGRLIPRPESVWITTVLLISALAHGVNMFEFPFYENDEGTYMAQAWSVTSLHQLSVYTYWYDHAPLGWLQLTAWTLWTGGFYTFGTSIDSGRVLMLLMHVGSTALVYAIARSITRSAVVAGVASLIFALSAYGIYFHRRVLLDNISTFWMLLSLALLVCGRLSLNRVWLSALTLGVSILSKELTIFLVPVLTYLVFIRSDKTNRWFAVVGWPLIVGSMFSLWFLMAGLKNELFETGTWLGGLDEHVSLLGSLKFQASRGQDGGLFNMDSGIWAYARVWSQEDPFVVMGGTICAILSVLLIPWYRMVGVVGLVTLSLWAFLARGGVVIEFYLVPLVPLLALNIALTSWAVGTLMARFVLRAIRIGAMATTSIQLAWVGCCLALLVPGYFSPFRGFTLGQVPFTVWTHSQASGQNQATEWAQRNLMPDSFMVIDHYHWLELRQPPGDMRGAPNVHWYWKVELDPDIRKGVFREDWHTVDYVIATPQLKHDRDQNGLDFIGAALDHSTLIARFDSGGWETEISRANKLQRWEAPADPMLARSWSWYTRRFIDGGRVVDPWQDRVTTSEGQSYALLRAVYMDDRRTFDAVWTWTKTNLQVRGDGLLAWRWGNRPDGTRGVLDAGAATDADQDAALALLFAARRWGAPEFQREALAIMDAIWQEETMAVGDRRILVAGDWARGDAQGRATVNPSYFAPYAYRVFAEADPDHDWLMLADSTYDLLGQILAAPDFGGPAGAVPNWLMVDAMSGALSAADELGDTADKFSFDASRLPWRLAVDWAWFKHNRAIEMLDHLTLARRELQTRGRLATTYRLDGLPLDDDQAISMYAGTLGALVFSGDPSLGHRVFGEKILQRYVDGPDGAHWGDPDNYYDQNWAWFAAALMDGALGNLWAGETVIEWDRTPPPITRGLDTGRTDVPPGLPPSTESRSAPTASPMSPLPASGAASKPAETTLPGGIDPSGVGSAADTAPAPPAPPSVVGTEAAALMDVVAPSEPGRTQVETPTTATTAPVAAPSSETATAGTPKEAPSTTLPGGIDPSGVGSAADTAPAPPAPPSVVGTEAAAPMDVVAPSEPSPPNVGEASVDGPASPDDIETYVVQWGDTLSVIARRSGVGIDVVVERNAIPNRDLIYAGQVLSIPRRAPTR